MKASSSCSSLQGSYENLQLSAEQESATQLAESKLSAAMAGRRVRPVDSSGSPHLKTVDIGRVNYNRGGAIKLLHKSQSFIPHSDVCIRPDNNAGKDYQELAQGAVAAIQKSDDLPVISVSDKELAADRGGVYQVDMPEEIAPLFGKQGPLPGDICQLRGSHTCYLLGAAAGYAATHPGREVLKQLICPVSGTSSVRVQLFDRLSNTSVLVEVSRHRILDRKCVDLYSFKTPGEPIWPALLDKALHAYLLDRYQRLDQCIAGLQAEKQAEAAGIIKGWKANLAGTSSGKGGRSNMLEGLDMLAPVDVGIGRGFAQPQTETLDSQTWNPSTSVWHGFRTSLAHGVPAILGKTGRWYEKVSALASGNATNHVYAVLGSGVCEITGEDGLICYDPYGSARGERGAEAANQLAMKPGEKLLMPRSGQATFFVANRTLSEKFGRLAVAGGGASLTTITPQGTGEEGGATPQRVIMKMTADLAEGEKDSPL